MVWNQNDVEDFAQQLESEPITGPIKITNCTITWELKERIFEHGLTSYNMSHIFLSLT